MIDIGSARLGMMVAEMLRRKRKMTSTTRPTVSLSVNLHVVERFLDGFRAVVQNVQVDGIRHRRS